MPFDFTKPSTLASLIDMEFARLPAHARFGRWVLPMLAGRLMPDVRR